MVTERNGSKARVAAAREEFWREQVRRQRSSGLSQAAFCRRNRLVPGTFAWWTRELRCRDQKRNTRAAPRFVPVRVLPGAPSTSKLSLDGALQVELANGRRIRVDPGFDPDALRQLLAVLEEHG